ncbi:zincin [Meira miltonrushii]|uniref:mitochondrial intermediate peptidase n=1 Tax=Meira miltonrushii TaxID=1280837 RepID=A0A316V8N8_9BASI|nr:zincin [Meira miltonrushii]PWN33584.1 zincin [Meira miltonrushii]
MAAVNRVLHTAGKSSSISLAECSLRASQRSRIASSSRLTTQSQSLRLFSSYHAQHAVPVTATSSLGTEADAKVLRELFDSPDPKKSTTDLSKGSAGLFLSDALSSTDSFEALAKRTVLRCQLIVSRILSAPQNGPNEMRRVVRNLDRLSDLLCGIIDCAELIRNAHPDKSWVDCANRTYEGLCGYMNELNTHTGLYHVLAQVLNDQELRSQLSQEALAVAYVFLRDFEKSGIHLPDQQRAKFVQLSDEILVLGRSFLQNGAEVQSGKGEIFEDIPLEWLKGASNQIVDALRKSHMEKDGKLRIRHNSWAMQVLAKYAPDSRAREVAYRSMNSGTPSQLKVLENLIDRRAELADLTGYESFSSMTLADKMARKPENVDRFLNSLTDHHKQLAFKDLEKLSELKQAEEGTSQLYEWDRDYYAEKFIRNLNLKSTAPPIGSFFSVGTVFAGLSRLFENLYGITLRSATPLKGETWAEEVSKVDVLEEGRKIGTIYADLYNRSGKPPSAAHYTVRCSRRTDDDDEMGDFYYGRLSSGEQVSVEEGMRTLATLDTNPVSATDREGMYQLPIVVLLFDFLRPTTTGQPSLLSWQEVETLFHEMGHAIHSMIGRTEYHNVSGTRCATDFVELPSILMEYFVSSPEVIGLVARHHATDAALPYSHLQSHLAVQRSLDSLDTHNQIVLASLDQLYHRQTVQKPRDDTTKMMKSLQSQVGILPPTKGTSWQVNFSHLFGYGATYYSYLFDRAIASRIWQKLFMKSPLDREAGEAFKKRVLAHGGGRDPWHMLADVLKDDNLAEGAESSRAMEAVGRWGIADVGTKV